MGLGMIWPEGVLNTPDMLGAGLNPTRRPGIGAVSMVRLDARP